MRGLVTSDWHADWHTDGAERLGDLRSAVGKMLDREMASIDVFFNLGDLTNPNSRNVHQACAFGASVARRCAESGVASVWIVGNHDVVEDGCRSTHTMLGIDEVSSDYVYVYSEPACAVVETQAGAIRVLALPYTSIGRAYDPREFVRRSAGMWDKYQRTLPLVIAGHLNIEGIEPGSESGEMARGRDVFFPIEEVEELYPHALLLNGHYHRKQTFRRIHIPGSPLRLTHGEESNDTGYFKVDFNG